MAQSAKSRARIPLDLLSADRSALQHGLQGRACPVYHPKQSFSSEVESCSLSRKVTKTCCPTRWLSRNSTAFPVVFALPSSAMNALMYIFGLDRKRTRLNSSH